MNNSVQNIFFKRTASFSDLQYFTVENTLADLAVFIGHVKEKLNATHAPVVVWGSNVGAKIAAWARQKYPHLIQAAWSSSGLFLPDPMTTSNYLL